MQHDIMFSDFVYQVYIPHLIERGDKKIKAKMDVIARFFLPAFSGCRFSEIDEGDVRAVFDTISAAIDDEMECYQCEGVLLGIYNLAVSNGVIHIDDVPFPHSRAQKLRHGYFQYIQNELRPVDEEVFVGVLRQIPDLWLRRILKLEIFTGAKRDEVIALKEEDYDPATHMLAIRRCYEHRRQYAMTRQSNYIREYNGECPERKILLSQTASEVVEQTIADNHSRRDDPDCRWSNPGNYIFVHEDGLSITPMTLYHKLKKLRDRYDIRVPNSRDIRRTFVYHCLREQLAPQSIIQYMGSLSANGVYRMMMQSDVPVVRTVGAHALETEE